MLIFGLGTAHVALDEPALAYFDLADLTTIWRDDWTEAPMPPTLALDCGLVRWDVLDIDGDWLLMELEAEENETWMMLLPEDAGT